MKTSITLVIALFISFFGMAINENHITTNYILFDTDKYSLDLSEKEKLTELVTWMNSLHDFKVELYGHTDLDGDANYNQNLSFNRVDAVYDFLIAEGISTNLISKDAFGESRPIDQQKHLNRRVEIIVTEYLFESISDLKETIQKDFTTQFELNPSKEINVECPNGVKISVLPNSFVDADGNIIDEPIELEVIEALDYSTFIANDLSCVSQDKFLESGGMAKITATTLDGRELKLKEGAFLDFSVPAIEVDNSMKLFISETGANWDLAATPEQISSADSTSRIDMNLEKPNFIPYSKIEYPDFVNNMKAPKRPYKPIKPKEPMEPKKSDVPSRLKWYQVSKKKKREENSTVAFNKAMRKFQLENAEYPVLLKEYELKQAQFLIDSAEYVAEYKKYEIDSDSCFTEYSNSKQYYIWKEYAPIQVENEKRRAKYLAEKDSLIEAQLASKSVLCEEDSKMIQAHVFRSQNLGWVNCDRFIDVRPSDIFVVKMFNQGNAFENAFMIYTDVKSIISMSEKNSKFTGKMKRSEGAFVYSMKIEDGKIWVFLEDAKKINKDTSPNFKMVKYQELQSILNNCLKDDSSVAMN